MRVLVTGSRKHSRDTLWDMLITDLESLGAPSGKNLTIIHGAAKGADTVAGQVAEWWGANEYRFPAEWDHYGRKFAGPIRNAEMLVTMKPDHVLAYPLEGSVGTWNCITKAHQFGIPVMVSGE